MCGDGEKRLWGNLDLATGVDPQPYLQVHIYRTECSRLFVISTPNHLRRLLFIDRPSSRAYEYCFFISTRWQNELEPKIRPMSSTPSSLQLLGQRFSWMKMGLAPQKDASTSCNIPNLETVISIWYHNLRSSTQTIPFAGRLSRSGQS